LRHRRAEVTLKLTVNVRLDLALVPNGPGGGLPVRHNGGRFSLEPQTAVTR